VPLRLSASTSYARYRKFGIRGGDFNCTPDGLAQGRGSIPRKPFLPVSASSDSFRLPRTTSSVISFNVPERRGRTRSQLPIHIHIQHTSINITFNSGAVRAENPPATKFIYALCHCGQLIGRRAVGLQGGSGSRALLHGRFYPLLWLRWFLHSIRWTGGTVRQAPRLEPRRRPILTQTVTATLPPPHAADKLQASRPRTGGRHAYCTSHGPRAARRQGACMQRCFPPSQIRVWCLALSWIHAAKCL
jgi:hypothetical protein